MFSEEIRGLLFGYMESGSIELAEQLLFGLVHRLIEQCTLEQSAVSERLAEQRKDAVVGRLPDFDGGQYIAVIKQSIGLQCLAMDSEVFCRNAIIEEIMECRRAEEFFALDRQLFSALEDLDE